MTIQPYLNFDGKCDEAIAFYQKALDAQVEMLMRFKDNPDLKDNPDPQACAGMLKPGTGDKVMHASLKIGDAIVMASDMGCNGTPDFRGVSLSLTVRDDAEAKRRFDALADGGQVQMPLGKTFWASSFGMVADRFGVSWMVTTPG
jgi:PhnB protein